MKTIPIIIDTDPGIDDAVAIAIALHDKRLDVRLITTVAGNAEIDNVTNNALKLLTFLNKKVKVAQGCYQPLVRDIEFAKNVHGISGMDGYTFPQPDTSLLLKEHAVEALYKTIINSHEKITIVAIAPLTNIAILLKLYPEVKNNIEQLVIMGGAISGGNKGVHSEFNFATDPEAAHIVLSSGLPIAITPLDVGLKALVHPEISNKIKSINQTGEMFYALFKKYRGGSFETGLKMYDSCAIAYLLEPEMYSITECFTKIDLQSDLSAGTSYVDLKGYLNQSANVKMCTDIDSEKFIQWFLKSVNNCV